MSTKNKSIFKSSDCSTTYSIACGSHTLERKTISYLAPLGFHHDSNSKIILVIDNPVGFAFHFLKTRSKLFQKPIVITWNTCTEYCDDLWELQPTVLIANELQDISTAIAIGSNGIQHRFTPCETSPLTTCERQILRLVAQGLSNQQIADELVIRCQSVRNILTTIYQKLNLNNRCDAVLYYWGTWFSRNLLD